MDPDVPLAESLGALQELREVGKVRHLGICNVDVQQLDEACQSARISSVQDRFDLTTRATEAVSRECERRGIAFLPWFPPDNERLATPGSALERRAAKHGASAAQVALAWLVQSSPVTVALPGATRRAWIEEDLRALALRLDGDDLRELTAMGDADSMRG